MADIERLRQLRRVVEAAPEERFKMDTWCTRETACGTAYCAAGWAAIDPWFQQNTEILSVFSVEEGGVIFPLSHYSSNMLAELFKIEYEDSANLFTEGVHDADLSRTTKEQVLANIDRLIAGQPARCYAEAPRA